MKREKLFATEADLCAAFLSDLPKGWTPYAETGGWDILLVRDADGFQIGVEAKLRLNAEVMNQALEEYADIGVCSEHPDCRAVLVPWAEAGAMNRIATYIGVTVIRVSKVGAYERRPKGRSLQWRADPGLPTIDDRWSTRDWHEWCPTKRHQLPEYVPDVRAGSSAPVQLTAWKINALKIAIILVRRGFVTRADFKHIGIDHRRWIHTNGWLAPTPDGYVATKYLPDFKAMHPRVWEEITADAEKWMPPTTTEKLS